MYIITGDYQGRRITRYAYSDFQAFTIINLLSREGVANLGMREGTRGEMREGNDYL